MAKHWLHSNGVEKQWTLAHPMTPVGNPTTAFLKHHSFSQCLIGTGQLAWLQHPGRHLKGGGIDANDWDCQGGLNAHQDAAGSGIHKTGSTAVSLVMFSVQMSTAKQVSNFSSKALLQVDGWLSLVCRRWWPGYVPVNTKSDCNRKWICSWHLDWGPRGGSHSSRAGRRDSRVLHVLAQTHPLCDCWGQS